MKIRYGYTLSWWRNAIAPPGIFGWWAFTLLLAVTVRQRRNCFGSAQIRQIVIYTLAVLVTWNFYDTRLSVKDKFDICFRLRPYGLQYTESYSQSYACSNTFVFVTFYWTEHNENSFAWTWSHAKHDCVWYSIFMYFCSLWSHLVLIGWRDKAHHSLPKAINLIWLRNTFVCLSFQ